MEIFNSSEAEFQELGVRVSRMRVSLRMKKQRDSRSRETSATKTSTSKTKQMKSEPPRHNVPLGPSSNTSIGSVTSNSGGGFRPRLSSHSSVCSTDSGFESHPSRSRVGSASSTSSSSQAAVAAVNSSRRQPGSILTKIAKHHLDAAAEAASKNADAEFAVFYRPTAALLNRSTSSVSTSSTSSSSRFRSVSLSSNADTTFSDIYSTIDELGDPFDDDDDADFRPPPPLPPRKARLRTPALPPYPSSAVSLVNKLSSTILC